MKMVGDESSEDQFWSEEEEVEEDDDILLYQQKQAKPEILVLDTTAIETQAEKLVDHTSNVLQIGRDASRICMRKCEMFVLLIRLLCFSDVPMAHTRFEILFKPLLVLQKMEWDCERSLSIFFDLDEEYQTSLSNLKVVIAILIP